MTDFQTNLFKLAPGGIVPFPWKNATFKIYEAGASVLVTQGTTDNEGNVIVTNLDSGKYDLKVEGNTVHTFSHIDFTDFDKPAHTWSFLKMGTINSDSDETANIPIKAPGRIGKIKGIVFNVEHIGATGDITIHILRGAINGASALTVASDSIYSYRAYPQAEQYRHSSGLIIPATDIIVEDDQAITIGWDYVAGTVEGLNVEVIFKPNE
jgi:hypothetical protein